MTRAEVVRLAVLMCGDQFPGMDEQAKRLLDQSAPGQDVLSRRVAFQLAERLALHYEIPHASMRVP